MDINLDNERTATYPVENFLEITRVNEWTQSLVVQYLGIHEYSQCKNQCFGHTM